MKLEEIVKKYKRYFNQNTFNFVNKALYDIDNYYLYLDKDVEDKISGILDRFLNGEPIEYILNLAYFYKNYYYVDNRVLLPEDETEELVDLVIKTINDSNKLGVDIGVGSGVIALTLKREMNANIIATDISSDALEVFKINNKDFNLKYYLGDALNPLIENNIKVDYIVSNPPYISYNDKEVCDSVDKYYPHIALYANNNGLSVYESILKDVYKVLNKDGYIFFEIGYNQAKDIEELAKKYLINYEFNVYKDINNHDRIIKIKVM